MARNDQFRRRGGGDAGETAVSGPVALIRVEGKEGCFEATSWRLDGHLLYAEGSWRLRRFGAPGGFHRLPPAACWWPVSRVVEIRELAPEGTA